MGKTLCAQKDGWPEMETRSQVVEMCQNFFRRFLFWDTFSKLF